MEGFLHQVFAGLATGGIYASVALALVMIYQSTHHLNFAQGELAMFCTFIAWALIQAGWPYWAAFFATIGASFLLGLAPLIVVEIFRIMRQINEEDGVSMLLVEQNASIALDLADEAYLLETGRVAISGPSDVIKGDETVRRAYLGY